MVTVKFASEKGQIVKFHRDTINVNNPSPIPITVPAAAHSPPDPSTLGSWISASFSSAARSMAPTVHTTFSYATATSRRTSPQVSTQQVPSWTQYAPPVVPNTVESPPLPSAHNMSTRTTTTPSAPPIHYSYHLTTQSFSTPGTPPPLTGLITCNPLMLQNFSPLTLSVNRAPA